MVDPTTLLLLTHITSKDAIANSLPSHPPACSHTTKLAQKQSAIAPTPDCISSPEAVSDSVKPSFSADQAAKESFFSPLLSQEMASALALPKSFTKLPKVVYSPPIRRLSPPGSPPGVLLKVGSQGRIVSKLQGKLKALGYFPEDIDGVYGQQTLAAVSKFQQAEGLRANGIVGAATWRKLQARSQSATSNNLEEKQRRRKQQSIPPPKIAQVIEETPTFSPSGARENPPRAAGNSQSLHSQWAEANLVLPSPSQTQPILQQQAPPRESVVIPAKPIHLSRWLSIWAIVYIGGMVKILGKKGGGNGSEFLRAILKIARLKPTFKAASLESEDLADETIQARDTLIGAFPDFNPETGDCYTYSLVDNVNGYFILVDNELRLADSYLLKPQKDKLYTVTVRRTDESGRSVDKSFVVRIPKAGDPKVEDMSGRLVRESYA